eukprot:scaffold33768_cov112-Isochrysis_galbana.AAC.6
MPLPQANRRLGAALLAGRRPSRRKRRREVLAPVAEAAPLALAQASTCCPQPDWSASGTSWSAGSTNRAQSWPDGAVRLLKASRTRAPSCRRRPLKARAVPAEVHSGSSNTIGGGVKSFSFDRLICGP